jgi:hypothetical protein
MKRKSLAGLVVLNVVLLLVLGVLCLTPQPASAQLGAGRGDYFMVSGQSLGNQASTLYIIDVVSGRLVAVTYDKQKRALLPTAGRDVNEDVRGIER